MVDRIVWNDSEQPQADPEGAEYMEVRSKAAETPKLILREIQQDVKI